MHKELRRWMESWLLSCMYRYYISSGTSCVFSGPRKTSGWPSGKQKHQLQRKKNNKLCCLCVHMQYVLHIWQCLTCKCLPTRVESRTLCLLPGSIYNTRGELGFLKWPPQYQVCWIGICLGLAKRKTQKAGTNLKSFPLGTLIRDAGHGYTCI